MRGLVRTTRAELLRGRGARKDENAMEYGEDLQKQKIIDWGSLGGGNKTGVF